MKNLKMVQFKEQFHILILIILKLIIEIIVLGICNKRMIDYFGCSLVINLLFFISVLLISKVKKYNDNKNNIPILVSVVLTLALELVILPKLKAPGSGEIYVSLCGLIIFLLISLCVRNVICSFRKKDALAYSRIMHLMGLIGVAMYSINQSHAIYGKVEMINTFIVKCALIYVEVLFFTFVLAKNKLKGI